MTKKTTKTKVLAAAAGLALLTLTLTACEEMIEEVLAAPKPLSDSTATAVDASAPSPSPTMRYDRDLETVAVEYEGQPLHCIAFNDYQGAGGLECDFERYLLEHGVPQPESTPSPTAVPQPTESAEKAVSTQNPRPVPTTVP